VFARCTRVAFLYQAHQTAGRAPPEGSGGPFDHSNQPEVALSEASRSFAGRVSLRAPRKRTGSSYVQDIEFVPPMGLNEVIDFKLSANIPSYKFAFREEQIAATTDTPLGPRADDYMTRVVSFPTGVLRMRAFLPASLNARITGVRAGRRAHQIDGKLSADLVATGCFREWQEVVNGVPGTFMELTVPNPVIGVYYRLAWTLPPRPPSFRS
jgi:hypothetical protein